MPLRILPDALVLKFHYFTEPTRQRREIDRQAVPRLCVRFVFAGKSGMCCFKTREAGVLEMLRIENASDSRLNMGHQAAILRPFQIGTLFEFRRLLAHGNEEDGQGSAKSWSQEAPHAGQDSASEGLDVRAARSGCMN